MSTLANFSHSCLAFLTTQTLTTAQFFGFRKKISVFLVYK